MRRALRSRRTSCWVRRVRRRSSRRETSSVRRAIPPWSRKALYATFGLSSSRNEICPQAGTSLVARALSTRGSTPRAESVSIARGSVPPPSLVRSTTWSVARSFEMGRICRSKGSFLNASSSHPKEGSKPRSKHISTPRMTRREYVRGRLLTKSDSTRRTYRSA
jgi:hypothetical protein